MKEIPLTKGVFALVDDEDYEYLNRHKWTVSKTDYTYYAIRYLWINKKRYPILMHRMIMYTPTKLVVDHVDKNGLNNQKCNLRNCTSSQNQTNKNPRGKSKYMGVYFVPYTYKNNNKIYIKAAITINKKRIYLGRFKTEIDAAKAYDKAAIFYKNEFANLNFK